MGDNAASNNVAPFEKIAGNATDAYESINTLVLSYVRIDDAVFAAAAVPVVRPLTEHVKILSLNASVEGAIVSTKFGEL